MNEKELRKEIQTIKSEISILKSLVHPNIVKYYNSDISED